jgi:hypothetical protein
VPEVWQIRGAAPGGCRRTRRRNRAPARRCGVCVNRSPSGRGGVCRIKLRPGEAAAANGASGGIELRPAGRRLRGSPVTAREGARGCRLQVALDFIVGGRGRRSISLIGIAGEARGPAKGARATLVGRGGATLPLPSPHGVRPLLHPQEKGPEGGIGGLLQQPVCFRARQSSGTRDLLLYRKRV